MPTRATRGTGSPRPRHKWLFQRLGLHGLEQLLARHAYRRDDRGKGQQQPGRGRHQLESKILPVRVLGKCGGYTSDIVDGLRWAAGLSVSGVPANPNPAKVANLSLGGYGGCDSTWQNAINAVTAAGMVVVVAAGNSNADASSISLRPVVMASSRWHATNRSGSRAYYSNYGSKVEISAPGGAQSFANDPNGILSTLNTGTTVPVSDTYVYYQGTSMATPHVTGVVSLMFSLNPSLTPAQVLQILQSTARPFPAGSTCNTSTMRQRHAGCRRGGQCGISTAISGFFPGCGPAGATVIIERVRFYRCQCMYGSTAPVRAFPYSSNTSINATVPAGATTGPISVTTPDRTATSAANFLVGTCTQLFIPQAIN